MNSLLHRIPAMAPGYQTVFRRVGKSSGEAKYAEKNLISSSVLCGDRRAKVSGASCLDGSPLPFPDSPRRESKVLGKKLLVYASQDSAASNVMALTNEWPCIPVACETLDEFRGKLEGEDFDVVVVEDSQVLKKLVAEADPGGEILKTPLAEVEKRHILRVLSSAGGNKTRAAKTLGIDTKTLYNKLKAYGAAAQLARRRQGQGPIPPDSE
jgi:DNA-binding protein Fis